MEEQAKTTEPSVSPKDQPGYGKPGRHSWKIEGKRSARNVRRLFGVVGNMRAHQDRVAALSEYLAPKVRRVLLRDYKRELAANPRDKRPAGEPARAQRRAELKAYARKVDVSPRLVWATYQAEKRKVLQSAA